MDKDTLSDEELDEIEVALDQDEEEEVDKEQDSDEEEKVEEQEDESSEDESEDDERQKFGRRAQKRIRNLIKARKELETTLQEQTRKLKELEDKLEESKGASSKTEEFAAKQYEDRLKAESEALEQAFNDAYDDGDRSKLFKIQKRLAEVAAAQRELDTWKKNRESTTKTVQTEKEDKGEDTTRQAPSQRGPSKKAIEWHKRNRWFTKDQDMTTSATWLHNELVEEGVEPDSDEYYLELDNRMKELYPEKFKARKTTPVNSGNSGNAKNPKKIKLTKEQVAIAKRMGVSVEAYARELAKINQRQG